MDLHLVTVHDGPGHLAHMRPVHSGEFQDASHLGVHMAESVTPVEGGRGRRPGRLHAQRHESFRDGAVDDRA